MSLEAADVEWPVMSPPDSRAPTNEGSTGAPASHPIDVLIVEDQRDIREGLARLIDRAAGFRCVGRYRSMEEALAGRPSDPPAVALLDIGLPGMSGIAGIEPLKARYPSVLVLMITVHDDDERIFEAMCAGACGYLLKKTPPARLIESVREVVAGGAPMSPEVARRVVELFRKFRRPSAPTTTSRRYELRLLSCSSTDTTTRPPPRSSASPSTPSPSTCATSTRSCECTRNRKPSRRRCASGSFLEAVMSRNGAQFTAMRDGIPEG